MNFIKEKNRIYLENKEGKIIAEITFEEIQGGVYNINHTFVDETLRGQGIASRLVEEAVKEIEARGAKVTATCSYASKWLEKNKSIGEENLCQD